MAIEAKTVTNKVIEITTTTTIKVSREELLAILGYESKGVIVTCPSWHDGPYELEAGDEITITYQTKETKYE